MFQDEIGAHKSNTTLITSEEAAEEDGLQTFFNNPFLTFVKTCTMFVGELEFSDIPIDLDSNLMPLSYFYFLSFVILIVVVLMNLLNGLAVSDIREIRERAEIVAYLSIVDTVSPFLRKSRNLKTGFLLVQTDHVTSVLASYWSRPNLISLF